MGIKVRKIALEAGQKIYEGSPCKHCGLTEKYTSDYACVKCSNERGIDKLYDGSLDRYKTPEKDAVRLKKWRKNNPNKIKAQHERQKPNHKKYYQEHKIRWRELLLKRKYNITLEEYDNMLLNQHKKCAICEIKECLSGKNFAVDDCHETGKIRGLLCVKCNMGIGLLYNSILLNKALKYIE